MYIKIHATFSDFDLEFLRNILVSLDSHWDALQREIGCSVDPDSDDLFTKADYLAGIGFALSQQYLSSTYGPLGFDKDKALAIGQRHAGGETVACIVNAAANYWKHSEEWDTKLPR